MIDKKSAIIWASVLTIGLCTLVLAAGSGVPQYYMAVTALISFAIAALGLREIIALDNASAPLSAVSASTARYMGLVYAWGALALFVTYKYILPEWREWPVFFGALSLVAVISLFFASAMSNDVARGKDDPTMLK
ncbi:MAG: hypothetical protein MUE84_17070, partial [Hyphomonas sp.]|nr:hypothetical protein [Hyphomonas sp.]